MIIRMLRINKYDGLARTLRQHRFALRPVPATDSLVERGWRLMFHPRPIEAGEGPPATRHGWRQAGFGPCADGQAATGCPAIAADRGFRGNEATRDAFARFAQGGREGWLCRRDRRRCQRRMNAGA